MSTFISNIKASDGATHHAAGFQKAFQLLRNTTSIGRQGISKSCRINLSILTQFGAAPSLFNTYMWYSCYSSSSATDMVIIYLSSGTTSRESSEPEKRATLSVIKEENRHLNNSVMILTYALMHGMWFRTRDFILRPGL